MMALCAAHEINNNDIVFCGTGVSLLAAMAAKNINAPDSVIFFETGAIDSVLEEIPLSVADSRIMFWTSVNAGLADAFATMQNRFMGQRIVGILGAAQIDIYGNLNTTVIGDYFKPKTRFSGSGGGCDVASFVNRTIIFMKHEARRFPEKLDYFTSPGWVDGNGGRERLNLPGGGPVAVITDMGVMRFDDATKKMYLHSYYPGVNPKKILDSMGFAVDISRAEELPAPLEAELEILRNRCDPQKLIL
jgi:glutaconate CoA-transferase subunit B